MESYVGQIEAFAFTFPPRGWALCNGQSVSIQQNQALYSLLGTTYGGNGSSYFNLPDLRGRAPIHYGQSPTLSTNPLLGSKTTFGSTAGSTGGTVGLIYCICTSGYYPSRS